MADTIEIKETIWLHEQNRYDYFHLDAKGYLHCLLPLTGGSTIGIDNTCKTLGELRSFFDERNPNCISKVINRYLDDLNFDIQQLQDERNKEQSEAIEIVLAEKLARHKQLIAYQEIVQIVTSKFNNIGNNFPQEILQLFNNEAHPKNNLISISLRPETIDSYVAVPVKQEEKKLKKTRNYPLFSVNRYGDSFVVGLKNKLNGLTDEVIKNPARKKEKTRKEKFIDEAVRKYLLSNTIQEQKAAITNDEDFSKLSQAMQYAAKSVLFPDLGPEPGNQKARELIHSTFNNVYALTAASETPQKIVKDQLCLAPGQDGSVLYSVQTPTDETVINQEIKKSELQTQLKNRYTEFFAALNDLNTQKLTPFLEDILQITSEKKHTLNSAKKAIDLAYLKDLTATEKNEGIDLRDAIEYWTNSTITPEFFDSIQQEQSATYQFTQQTQLAFF